MPILIRHLPTNKELIYIGSGFGMYQSKKPNWFLGDLVSDTDEGNKAVIYACNKEGKIILLYAEDVKVISINGIRPDELIE